MSDFLFRIFLSTLKGLVIGELIAAALAVILKVG